MDTITNTNITVCNKKSKFKKGLLIFTTTLGLIIILLISIFAYIYRNEIRALTSLESLDNNKLFTMEFKGDYGFDDFLISGASTDEELLQFITSNLLHGIPMKFDLPDLGCSTFVSETPDGEKLMGRNFDMYYSPALFVKTTPTNGYDSISMVNLAYMGYSQDNLPTDIKNSILTLSAPYMPLDGVNEKGLSCAVLMLKGIDSTNQNTEKVDITTTTLIRLLLDKAANVDEALALIDQYDMHSSANSEYHFQIADSTGRSVVVEYIDNQVSILEERQATNFLLTPGVEHELGIGQDRYETMKQKLSDTNGFLTEDESMNLLSDVSFTGNEDLGGTQWSCVYNLTDPSVSISINGDYSDLYKFHVN